MGFIYLILIGAAAGFLAGWLLKGKGFGVIVNILLGIGGSFFGKWIFSLLGIHLGNGFIGTLITATIGAVLLVVIVNLIRGKK